MMGRVNCLYCGELVGDDLARCPHCGAPSHFQQRGWRLGARRRFVVFFVLFALLVLAIALWLPR